MPRVRRDDAEIAYELVGPRDGTPLVIVQGLGMPGSIWQPFAEKMAPAGYRSLLIDNRGTGTSSKHKPPFFLGQPPDDIPAGRHDAEGDHGPAVGLCLLHT